jgi:hypothetical protein
MTMTTRMSAPTPKSMPWPTPQRPAQATPVRRELFQPGENPGGPGTPEERGGIHPASDPGWGSKWGYPFGDDDSD